MPCRLRDLACLLALAGATMSLSMSLSPSLAAAQAHRVAVLPFEGRGSSSARDAIAAGLRERGFEVDVVDEVPAGADAAIAGTANVRGRNWRVRLVVRDASGAEAGAVSMPVRGRRGLPRLLGRLAAALERVRPAAAGSTPSPTPAPAPGGTRTEPSAAPAVSASAVSPSAVSPSAVSPSAGSPAAQPTAPASAEGGGSSDDGPPMHVLVLVGAGVRGRTFELLSPDGLNAGYSAEPYFEVTARAEARFFDALFVRTGFGSSIGLDSVSSTGSPLTDTLFVWLRADAGASLVIDDTVELGAAFGVGWDRYQMQFNDEVPTAEYLHLRPAFVSAFRFAGEALVLDAEIGVRIPFGVGDLESLYGVDHDVLGLDGVMRLHGVVDPGFAWAIEAGARRYWLTFRSTGGDITATDSGWHASGYAGWQF